MIDTRYAPINDKDAEDLRSILDILKGGDETKELHIAEIGCATGGATKVLAEYGKVYSVDPYLINPDVKYDFLNIVQQLDVQLFHMTSEKASQEVIDGLDLVFIDGSHDYGEVRKDIEKWLPKIKKGGIICGHDCVTLAKNGMISLRPYQNYTRLSKGRDTVCFHVGVILAVSDTFPNAKIVGDRLWMNMNT